MANRFARYVEQAPANRFAKYSQPEQQDEPAREPDTSFFREPVSVGGRVGVGGEHVFNSVGATGEARLRLDEEPPAEETPEQARLKRDSAWIDETMRQFTSREGIDALHAEARAAGVPLGRAVRWKRNQLERQAKAGSLQPPETPSLSMADVNEQSTRERAGAIEFADELRGRIGQWPNTGEGEDPELFSALEVIEQYRKQVAPEVPGPRFMRQLFPREMAQQQERDPNGSWSAAGESLLQSIKQTAAGGAQALGERLRYAGNYIPAVRGLLDTPANFLRTEGYEQGAEALARMNELGAQMAPRPTASVYDDPEGWARYFGQQGVASSGLTLAGMGASLVNPALGAATFLGGAGGSEYGRARIEDGASPSEAGVRALTSVATEGIPEMLGGAAMLGRLPLMGLAQSTARGRAAIAIPTEAGTEGLTEKLNIEAERARGKYISPEEESARIQDAVVIGGMLGGGMGTGSAAIESGARSLQGVYEFAGQAADLTRQAQARATTERILGRTTPPQTPQEAQTDAGAGIAEAAIQNALAARPVQPAPVAQSDVRENDELDRLLVGALGGVEENAVLGDQLQSDTEIAASDIQTSNQAQDLPDGTYFIPGDPAAIRQRLADAGVETRGVVRAIDGQTGVRFGANTREQVLGVLGGGNIQAGAEVHGGLADLATNVPAGTELAAGRLGLGRAQSQAPIGMAQVPDSETNRGTAQPTQAEAAVDVAPPKPRNYRDTQFDERKHDLLDFIAMNGGLDRAAAESEGVDPSVWKAKSAENDRFFGKPAFKKGGMSIETLREKLAQSNFAPIAQSRDALDLVFDALGGREVVTPEGATWRQQQRERDENERIQRALSDLPASMRSAAEQAQMQSAIPDGDVESLALAQQADRDQVRDDILSGLPSVHDQSPAQRVSAQSLGADYTDRLLSLMGARKSGAMTEAEREEYTALLEQDRETGKVNGRPMVGVGNKTGYVDALSQGRLRPVQVFTDADQFKLVNDKLGHDVGDEVIRLYGNAMIAEFGQGRVWHRGGDEFLADAETDAEADAAMARVAERMRNIRLEVPLSDGRTAVLEGIGVSYGKGATEKDADEGLKRDKERRKRLGLRADRQDADSRSVDPQPDGAGSQASRADSRRGDGAQGAAAEGVSVERQTQTDVGALVDGPAVANDSGRDSANRRDGQAESRIGRETGGTVDEVRSAVSRDLGSKFLRRLESQPWFNLVESLDQLPPDVRKSISGDDIAGFVLPDGRVFIIADNVGDNATGIVLHEVGVHFGMSGLPDFPAMLAQFKRLREGDDRVAAAYKRAEAVADRDKNGNLTADAKALLDEEAFAYYVEQNWNVKTPLMTRIKDAIARLLNRLGVPTSMIDDAMMRQALDGMVQSAREAADKATRGLVTVRDGKIVYHKAWHGSPHDFDKFRLDDSTIGTGEGAQAFGHGLYFAGRKELGEYYRDTLSRGKGYSIGGKSINGAPYGIAEELSDAAPSDPVEWARETAKSIQEEIDDSRSEIADAEENGDDETLAHFKRLQRKREWLVENGPSLKLESGRLYEVELAPDESDYLDWDAPLSEQSEKVRAGVRQAIRVGTATVTRGDGERPFSVSIDGKTLHRYKSEVDALEYADELNEVSASEARIQMDSESATTGEQAYRAISESKGGDREASRVLHAAGIPGIRYLDGSSRGKGDGSRNYVIFDDSLVEVKAKYSRRADGGPESLRVVAAGDVVDGRTVREGVPNQSSIASSLDDYTILKGIREVPMSAFDKEYVEGIAEGRIDNRTQALADAIAASKEIAPLIVAYDADGAYIIEGGHRLDALIKIGAKSLPAMVVIDEANPPKPATREGLGASGPRYSRRPDTITVDGVDRPTTDSTGKPIHPTEEGLRNFWRWFGESKVVDEQGRPLVVYHGTPIASGADAGELVPYRFSKEYGVFFTPDRIYANDYAMATGRIRNDARGNRPIAASNVVPAYIKIIKPLTRDFGGKIKEGPEIQRLIEQTTDDIGMAIYDGVVAKNIQDSPWGGETHPSDVYVVFESAQIKSAIGNSGSFSPTDKRIAYSRRTPQQAQAESAQKQAELARGVGAVPGQTFAAQDRFTDDWKGTLRKAREKIQDKLLSVRDVQRDVEKVRGALDDAMNVYRRENLMHGRVGQQRDQLERTHLKPLLGAMAKAKIAPELLEDYVEARHAEERNKAIAAKQGGMPDAGAGMTTQAAADFLAGNAAGHRSGVTLTPDLTRTLDRLAKRVDAIAAETRQRLYQSGQITKQQLDELENAYQFYVPLRGKDGEEDTARGGTGKGIDVRGKPIQRALGRGDGNRAVNILAEVVADAERSIITAEKARVGRTLARLVIENPNPDVWAIEPVKTEQAYSESADEIYMAVKNLDQDPNTIIVKVSGKPYRIYIEDTRIAEALKNLAVEQLPVAVNIMAGINRYFSAVLTRYNPSFVAVNLVRDMIFGMTGLAAEHGAKSAADAAKNYLPAMRAMWREARGTLGNSRMDRFASEFAEAGGKTYFGKLENVPDIAQRIGMEFKTARQIAINERRPLAAIGKLAKDSRMVQAIENANDAVENALRLAAYAARREAGDSVEKAAEYAKNLTVNFNRRGAATSWLNALYLFFNASVQGSHRVFRLLKNRKVQAALGGLALAQAAFAMLAMGYDDEDGEPLWDSIPDWEKQRNFIIVYPYINKDGKVRATLFKIPMPYGFNIFPYLGGRTAALANDIGNGKKHAIRNYINDSTAGVLGAMAPLPFGEDGGFKAWLPHWLRLTGMLSENKDDLGMPIRAGEEFDRYDRPRSAKGRDDTSEAFKMMATALNRIGGGDDYNKPMMPWLLDWAPDDLEFIAATAGGGLSGTALKGQRMTEKLIAGVPVNFKDVPILSSFVSNVDQRQATSSRYYERKDEIERQIAQQRDIAKETGNVEDNKLGIRIARNKSGQKIKRGEGYELEGVRGSLFATYKDAEKEITRIRDEMRATYRDSSIDFGERARRIDALKVEREEVQREVNAKWREVFGRKSR